jgi:hypothetical protein
MHFQVHGPFELPRLGRRILRTPADRKLFWASVDEAVPGLSDSCGCYVFTVRGQVWYVGLAERQSFKKECYIPHKVLLFDDALHAVGGNAALIFIPKITLKERFAKPTKGTYPAVHLLEDMLIGLAINRNYRLLNIRGTKFLKEMRVPGIINTPQGGARSLSVQALKKALGTR